MTQTTMQPLTTDARVEQYTRPLLGGAPSFFELPTHRAFKPMMRTIFRAMAMASAAAAVPKGEAISESGFPDAYEFNLKQYRKAALLSQKEVAKALRISQATYSRVETHHHRLPPSLLAKAAQMMGLDPIVAGHMMVRDLQRGLCHNSPATAAALLVGGDVGGHKRHANWLQWAITVASWRTQVGLPMTVQAARRLANRTKQSVLGAYLWPRTLIRALDTGLEDDLANVGGIDAELMLGLAIAYGVSPLCLLNGWVLSLLKSHHHHLLGHKARTATDTNPAPTSFDEAGFQAMRDVCCDLELVPEWQRPWFRAPLLSEVGLVDNFDEGELRYRPFPLSYQDYESWASHPFYQDMAATTEVGDVFEMLGEQVAWPLPPNEVLHRDEARYWLMLEPSAGLASWQQHLAATTGARMDVPLVAECFDLADPQPHEQVLGPYGCAIGEHAWAEAEAAAADMAEFFAAEQASGAKFP